MRECVHVFICDYARVSGQHKKTVSVHPSAQGQPLSVGGFREAQERVLFFCDTCVGIKGVLGQSPENSCHLPTATCQHTPQPRRAGTKHCCRPRLGTDSCCRLAQAPQLKESEEGTSCPLSSFTPSLLSAILCSSQKTRPYDFLIFPLPCTSTQSLGQSEEKKGNAWTEEAGELHRGQSKENNLKEEGPEKGQEIIHLVMNSSHVLYVPPERC